MGLLAFVFDAIEWLVGFVRRAEPAPRRPRHVRVPDLTDLPISEARLQAMRAGVHLSLVRTQPNPPPVQGIVTQQSPGPGTRMRRDSTVTVWLTFR
ncbi:PASTA domain-containing protein [Acrocarpospora catenulata]|uniref:PASTA domain-containing protein n=1 Tax=Acrocarpospora catenulata TaxID=2836182 RepID=UPI0035562E87